MNRFTAGLFSTFVLVLSLSCSPSHIGSEQDSTGRAANGIFRVETESQVSFNDQTEELVGHAERLIEKNQKEGAVLDQRWYTLKRFGQYQDVIFGASQIVFYGGLEDDVRRQSKHPYTSIVPLESDQEPGEIRLFIGARRGAQYDFVIVGQNGKEVALKTVIRLLYLAKFVEDDTRRKYRDKLRSFRTSLRVLMSSVSAEQEFIRFFNKHGISNPDVVMIGFIGDTRSLIRGEGFGDPQAYSDESLRVNWYANANGMRVLLVSIDHNRIYASRSGELIEAIFKISGPSPPSITFLGSGGAIDEPEIVGKIVIPTIVVNGDPFPAVRHKGVLVHLIRNRAVDGRATTTAHASVENVVVETTQWAHRMRRDRVKTVDQELFHIVNAINSSAMGRKVAVFVGILVTDNVSSEVSANVDVTLEHAEETISKTAAARREFLSGVLTKIGILDHEKTSPEQKESAS